MRMPLDGEEMGAGSERGEALGPIQKPPAAFISTACVPWGSNPNHHFSGFIAWVGAPRTVPVTQLAHETCQGDPDCHDQEKSELGKSMVAGVHGNNFARFIVVK